MCKIRKCSAALCLLKHGGSTEIHWFFRLFLNFSPIQKLPSSSQCRHFRSITTLEVLNSFELLLMRFYQSIEKYTDVMLHNNIRKKKLHFAAFLTCKTTLGVHIYLQFDLEAVKKPHATAVILFSPKNNKCSFKDG